MCDKFCPPAVGPAQAVADGLDKGDGRVWMDPKEVLKVGAGNRIDDNLRARHYRDIT
ncbi:hypothetical protein Prum_070390 [Phytohabitans rumicis]|uniref:Uncharacterized protein n=1 Tax=Phytohabitans rumicis TaxID=1076125 RepID=A0A6V8LH33_9ACTN|nr:hypothetical protein Prum_070390 [Phytohabitans rumicis]